MKIKRRSWRFSQGGAALFMLFLLAPFVLGFSRLWPTHGASARDLAATVNSPLLTQNAIRQRQSPILGWDLV
jgi:hypothetical protein